MRRQVRITTQLDKSPVTGDQNYFCASQNRQQDAYLGFTDASPTEAPRIRKSMPRFGKRNTSNDEHSITPEKKKILSKIKPCWQIGLKRLTAKPKQNVIRHSDISIYDIQSSYKTFSKNNMTRSTRINPDMCMTIQKEIQQTPVTFHKMCDRDIDDIEINSVFQENSSRQLFRANHKQTPVFCPLEAVKPAV